MAPILPGATLGMLGDGQLGRMFALAARRMGYRIAVFGPGDDTPGGQVADHVVRADYDDLAAVERFAREVEVVTFEFENVPAETAAAAARHAPVRPAGAVLHAAQNRIREKTKLDELGLPVAPWLVVEEASHLDGAITKLGGEAILKSAASGYDGKGQRRIKGDAAAPAAWAELGEVPCVLEGLVDFEREISIVGARDVHGEVVLYEPFENAHANHILDVTLAPARIDDAVANSALEIARAVFEGLDITGVSCIEMFVLSDGSGVLVNEIAPRPHNSGHVTIDAHVTSQFEQQVRAVTGLPLGDVSRMAPGAAMANLLGDLWSDGTPDWSAAQAFPGVRLHLYGKGAARPGRKMGHLTATAADGATAEKLVRDARAALTGKSA